MMNINSVSDRQNELTNSKSESFHLPFLFAHNKIESSSFKFTFSLLMRVLKRLWCDFISNESIITCCKMTIEFQKFDLMRYFTNYISLLYIFIVHGYHNRVSSINLSSMWLTAHSQWTAKWLLKVVNDTLLSNQKQRCVFYMVCLASSTTLMRTFDERNLRDIITKILYTRMNKDVLMCWIQVCSKEQATICLRWEFLGEVFI